jgi:siroheme synthase-like protein
MNAMAEPIDDGYPVVLRVAGRPVLVVGGGPVALRKVQGLVGAGAAVTVVSPDFVGAFDDLEVRCIARPYRCSDLEGMRLVIAATNDPAVQQQVFDDCERAGIWVNSADDPDRCSFILPALTRRGPIIVAVSTQGRSPALAQQLRDRVAASLPADLEQRIAAAAARRDDAHARGDSTEDMDWSGLLD